ncbi:MAG: NHL repeat-containing protein [Burkholderiales bacterium]|nr:NHL repeat-containing protein [Opitutaceae bacterium]
MHHLASRASFAFRLAGFLLGIVLLATAAHAQVLVSDYNLARVLRYDADGANSSVLVAPAAGGLDQPHRARLGPDGRLYVASAGSDQILRYDADTGAFIDVFVQADSGVDYPVDFAFRPDGHLYVSSQGNSSILRYDATTGARDLTWIASSPDLFGPSGLVFDAEGHLYVSGRFSNNLARFDLATGAHQLTFGDVPFALGIVLLPDGRLLAASGHGNTVEAFAAPASVAPAQSTFTTGLSFPVGLELDPLTDTLLVANYTGASISRHALADGAALAAFASGGLLSGPNYFTVLTPAAIPEPSACATAASIAALLLASLRRPSRRHR